MLKCRSYGKFMWYFIDLFIIHLRVVHRNVSQLAFVDTVVDIAVSVSVTHEESVLTTSRCTQRYGSMGSHCKILWLYRLSLLGNRACGLGGIIFGLL